MNIAISGLHSQGKTTLINSLRERIELKNFNFADSPTRALSKIYPINEFGNQHTQLFIMMGHYANLATAENSQNTIFDRCALDGLAYSRYFFDKINISVVDIINRMYNMMISKYDIIFYVEPELELVNDGERSLNIDFFNFVKLNFRDIINTDCLKVRNVSGTIEERTQYVVNTICEYKQLNFKI